MKIFGKAQGIFLVVFGLMFFSASAQEIGLQLYSLRSQFGKDVPGTMALVRSFRIKQVELAGTYGLSVPAFKKILDDNGLTVICDAADYTTLQTDPQAAADRAKVYGAKYVACHWAPHSDEFTVEEAKKVVGVLNAAGKVMKENGLIFCYHPHGFEFRSYEDGTVFDYMAKNLDTVYVHFEMDVYWVKHPGQDPVTLLKKYPGRWLLMHLKDRKPGTLGNLLGQTDVETNVVLGQGDIGIKEIMKTARKAGVRYFFIEDESSRSVQQIPASLKFLKSLK